MAPGSNSSRVSGEDRSEVSKRKDKCPQTQTWGRGDSRGRGVRLGRAHQGTGPPTVKGPPWDSCIPA